MFAFTGQGGSNEVQVALWEMEDSVYSTLTSASSAQMHTFWPFFISLLQVPQIYRWSTRLIEALKKFRFNTEITPYKYR